MEKVKIPNNVFIPMPMTLVGTVIEGQTNFMAVGWVSRVNADPPMIAVGINRAHYTPAGIQEHRVFSVNFPHPEMLEKTDYCGVVSGKKQDKSEVFTVFYGEHPHAPLIDECRLCLECKLVETVELPSNYLFIGEIVAAHAAADCVDGRKLDFNKLDPVLLTMPDNQYWKLGDVIGRAWSTGLKMKKERESQ